MAAILRQNVYLPFQLALQLVEDYGQSGGAERDSGDESAMRSKPRHEALLPEDWSS
jgi:hypothetical protein